MPKGLQRHLFGDRTAEPYHPEILRHPFRAVAEPKPNDERVFLLAIERDHERASESDDGLIWVIGTDGSEDRHGSVLNPGGWEIESYMRNPVLQAFHRGDIPVVGTTSPKRVGGKWEFGMRFAVDEWTDTGMPNLPKLFRNLYLADVMRAVSVSFLPKEWKDREAETIPSWFAENIQYVRQELTELSVVNVPSNRNALKKALGDGVVSEREIDFLGFGSFLRLELPAFISSATAAEDRKVVSPAEKATVESETRVAPTESRDEYCWRPTTPLTTEYAADVKEREIAILAEMADDALALVDAALVRWRGSQSDPLRWTSRIQITEGLYWYESAYEWSRDWYGVTINDPDLAADVLDSLRAVAGIGTRESHPGFREIAEHIRRDPMLARIAFTPELGELQHSLNATEPGDLSRADAPIGKKVRRRLEKAIALIGECLADVAAPSESSESALDAETDLDEMIRGIEFPTAPDAELDTFASTIGGLTDGGSARNSTPLDSATGTAPTKSRFDLMLSDLQ